MDYIAFLKNSNSASTRINEPDENGLTLLIAAARHGHIVAVRHLVKLNALMNSVDGSGQTALIAAIRNGHHKIALELIAIMDTEGINIIDNDGMTALICASAGGAKLEVDALLSKFEGIATNVFDQDGFNAMHHAANNGHAEIVHRLLIKGFDPNMRVKVTHVTPLILAAMNGHTATMKTLLSQSISPIDIEMTDKLGLNALHYSARLANAEGVKLLASKGANVNAASKRDGETPIHAATVSNCIECVSILLQHKANTNCQLRKSGVTPLMSAVANSHVNLIQLLISAGSDKTLKNKDSFTALDIAKSKALPEVRDEIIKLLSVS